VLRDRAAAARKAFNRADALVELAQGYLRGDRPDHSPFEVTLTVPASVLRGEHADPVEVGEIGGKPPGPAVSRTFSSRVQLRGYLAKRAEKLTLQAACTGSVQQVFGIGNDPRYAFGLTVRELPEPHGGIPADR
jgi:hypothetical protein